MAATLSFSRVILFTFDKNNPQSIILPSNKIYKIESVGIAGSNGTVFLQDSAHVNLAILFSTIDSNDFGAAFPFWIPPGFDGFLYNDSAHKCAVSITEYDYAP